MAGEGVLFFVSFRHWHQPVFPVGVQRREDCRVLLGVDTHVHSRKRIYITESDRVELPEIDAHAVQASVLEHNADRQGPLRGHMLNNVGFVHALDLICHKSL